MFKMSQIKFSLLIVQKLFINIYFLNKKSIIVQILVFESK